MSKCCVCNATVYMVEPGEGPIVCCWDSPEFLVKHLDNGQPLNEWGQKKLAWAKAVIRGDLPLGPVK